MENPTQAYLSGGPRVNQTPRIAAGGLVMRDGKLLLVSHRGPTGNIFWIPPGGGMESGEGALACAEREVFEETGIRVRAERVAYVQEILDAKHHQAKFWVWCTYLSGEVTLEHLVPEEVGDLLDARFMNRDEVSASNVVPDVVKDGFWADLEDGFPATRYLGLTRIHPG